VTKDNWIFFKNIDNLSERLAHEIIKIANKSIKLRGEFKIVLTGGRSVLNTYKILSNSKSDWSKWHIYLGDERCVPVGDKDRNDCMINRTWLECSLIPHKNIHFIHAELGPSDGALHYEKTLSNVGSFDVVLLSMGEDGHIASLFPDHLYDESKDIVFELNAPKYPKERISMSYSRLNQASYVFKIISGASKQNALEAWTQGKDLPINKIRGLYDKVYIVGNYGFT